MSMGITQMSSLLSSQSTLKHIGTINSARTSLSGAAGVLVGEIKMDKLNKVCTAKKEEQLAELEQKIDSADEYMSGTMTELNERIAADQEKIRAEEAEREALADKAKTVDEAEKAGVSGVIINVDAATDIAEPLDAAEISSAGKAAAFAVKSPPVSVSSVPAPPSGEVIDARV